MAKWFFVSDLHGNPDRYRTLFELIRDERPEAVFMGGDLLPSALLALSGSDTGQREFLSGFLLSHLARLREDLGTAYPHIFVILGNDDGKAEEAAVVAAGEQGAWQYIHGRRTSFAGYDIYGYACVPPTPFLLKDWERYDVSRYVDPGCISPEGGRHSVPSAAGIRFATIKDDLAKLVGKQSGERAVLLFHSPPYKTKLDRAALDGKMVDQVPLDVHVGSIAIARFIKERQPLVTMHGHIHESARLTGSWRDQIGKTHCYSAAHDGPELALVRFDPEHPEQATRTLI